MYGFAELVFLMLPAYLANNGAAVREVLTGVEPSDQRPLAR